MTSRRHYKDTAVSVMKSMTDIESLLRKHKANGTRWTTVDDCVRFEFTWPYQAYQGQQLGFRIDLKIPTKDRYNQTHSESSREQEKRRLLRVLYNHVKAKLVAVEEGLAEFEREFMPYLLTSGVSTAGDDMMIEIRAALTAGRLPTTRLLPEGRG